MLKLIILVEKLDGRLEEHIYILRTVRKKSFIWILMPQNVMSSIRK